MSSTTHVSFISWLERRQPGCLADFPLQLRLAAPKQTPKLAAPVLTLCACRPACRPAAGALPLAIQVLWPLLARARLPLGLSGDPGAAHKVGRGARREGGTCCAEGRCQAAVGVHGQILGAGSSGIPLSTCKPSRHNGAQQVCSRVMILTRGPGAPATADDVWAAQHGWHEGCGGGQRAAAPCRQ